MCQLPPKKPNIEEKKQNNCWRQLPLKKAKFVKFGFKNAYLATLVSTALEQNQHLF